MEVAFKVLLSSDERPPRLALSRRGVGAVKSPKRTARIREVLVVFEPNRIERETLSLAYSLALPIRCRPASSKQSARQATQAPTTVRSAGGGRS
jgi:hypothetical protein